MLVIANYLNGRNGATGEEPASPQPSTYPDVDGDLVVTADDAAVVIAALDEAYAPSTGSQTPPPPATCPPSVTLNVPADVNEGEVFTIDGLRDGYVYAIDNVTVITWPDQTMDVGGWSADVVFDDDDPTSTAQDSMPITVWVADWCTFSIGASATGSVTVHNLDPTISLSAPAEVDEGSTISVDVTISDPGPLDTPQTLTVDWGDGETTVLDSTNGDPLYWGTMTFDHAYVDDALTPLPSDDYTISATITDDDSGSGSQMHTLTVKNVDPTVDHLHRANRRRSVN